MADFNIQPVATQIKPIQGMSLGDMVNLARGAQLYQQAEQINPLEVQIRQQQARTGEIALGVEEQKNKERLNFQTFMSDPNNYMTDNKFDEVKFNTAIPKIMPLTGTTAIKDLTGLAQAQSEALRAKHNLTQDKRDLVARTLGLAGRAGVNDPAIANEMLDMLVQQNPNDQDLKNLVERGYKPVFGKMQAGPGFADSLVKAGQQMLTPSQLETTFEPKVTVTPEARTVVTQKMPGTAQPTATIGTVSGLQAPAAPTAEVPAGTQVAPGMRLPYQVRRADQPYIPEPSERVDLEAGLSYRNKLVGAQTGLAQNRRNTEEVINQANKIASDLFFEKGGIPGQIEQKIRMAIGSEQYDMLAKDLANMALSNTQAMGGVGNTVAGLDMQQVANGTIKVPPDVLVKIARRVQADQTNLDMQANGAQAFSQRFGDNNMKAYQQAWNANADTKIFEAMNIIKDVSDTTQREKELNRLFPDEKKRSDFLTKYRNLKKLSETGSL
jgi:hypothetical protein